ncbi:hypothetical protein BJ917_2173 [Pseudomonas sp. WPR_5_2]|nr:hypothetical protein BJ917_2173 [Pseudomonas sp. WPR_5_2]
MKPLVQALQESSATNKHSLIRLLILTTHLSHREETTRHTQVYYPALLERVSCKYGGRHSQ